MRLFKIAIAALVILALVLVVNTLGLQPADQFDLETTVIDVDIDRIVDHMREAITFETISVQPGSTADTAPFDNFLAFLEQSYPNLHHRASRQLLADYTALYTWQGQDPSLKPVLLTAHYDVVPVIPGTEDLWRSPPFTGNLLDGYIYGRGALDDKSAVITLMEAAEQLATQDFTPARTLYISLGHDEEIGGYQGAASVASLLQEQGVQLAWSLDEGSFVVEGVLPIAEPVAMINVAEKGYVSLDLIATGIGGHSSMPPPKTAVSKLAEALVTVQASPLRGGLSGTVGETLDGAAPYLPFYMKLFIANRWLFSGVLESVLGRNPAMNATMRTTIAPTMLSASVKENVLPIEARARVNLRLHPRDTPDSVLAHFESALSAHPDVSVEMIQAAPASSVASTTAEGYQAIARNARRIFGDIIVVPGLTVGGTDSKHYGTVTDDAYRFNPMRVGPEDVAGFHGTNERISVDNLADATRFYIALMKDL
jgi:carboxypeptidase PM20D1